MNRREFIKNSLICGCAACFGGVCFSSPKSLEDMFFFKSKNDLPRRVFLESCSLCQLRCVKCWRVTNTEVHTLGYLKFEDFKKFVDDNPVVNEIDLALKGEMFLNPELDKIIKYAHEKNIILTAYSGVNGNYISDEIAELLVKTQFRNIVFSIDGATQDVYKIYRVGGNIDSVFENIKKINFYKNKYNSKYPELTYKFIVFGHNEHEIIPAKEKAKELGMGITFDTNYAPAYSPVIDKKMVKELTGLSFDTLPEQRMSENQFIMCQALFNRPVFFYNGLLRGCCMADENRHFDDINVFKDGYLKAMNGAKIAYARRMLANYKTPAHKDLACSKCFMYKQLKKHKFCLMNDEMNK